VSAPVRGVPGLAPAGPTRPAGRAPARGAAFDDLLAAKLRTPAAGTQSAVRFSGHAAERLARRGIALDASSLARLQAGVDRAAGKGSRDSLVLVDDTAFVVSVRNRTVVTAVDKEHMREQVFTNIDSAVIA